jgi:hypothetical protein
MRARPGRLHRQRAIVATGTLAAFIAACSASPPAGLGAAYAAAHSKGCYAEVWYSDQTYGHTYEYLCGNLRLHAGQTVRVPVRNYVTTARVVRISRYRTYFGGPLKTVRAVIS